MNRNVKHDVTNDVEIQTEAIPAAVEALKPSMGQALLQNLKSTPTNGKTSLSGASGRVLALLRQKGSEGAGLTAKQINEALGLKDLKEVRKRTRDAIDAAAAFGDLVFTISGVGGTRATKAYHVIPKESASQLDTVTINGIFDGGKVKVGSDEIMVASATDFSYNGRVKGRFVKEVIEA